MSTELWISLFAFVLSLFSLYVSWCFGRKDLERRKKQGTIEYFEEITFKYFNTQALFNAKMSKCELDFSDLEKNPDLLKDAKAVLSAFERLSVGVNTGVYDFDILNRMAGSYLVYMFNRFSPYIEQIRTDASRQKSYTEFELLVQKIKNENSPVSTRGNI